jgi:hypothetical protein
MDIHVTYLFTSECPQEPFRSECCISGNCCNLQQFMAKHVILLCIDCLDWTKYSGPFMLQHCGTNTRILFDLFFLFKCFNSSESSKTCTMDWIEKRTDDVEFMFIIYSCISNKRKWLIRNPSRLNFGLFVWVLVYK